MSLSDGFWDTILVLFGKKTPKILVTTVRKSSDLPMYTLNGYMKRGLAKEIKTKSSKIFVTLSKYLQNCSSISRKKNAVNNLMNARDVY